MNSKNYKLKYIQFHADLKSRNASVKRILTIKGSLKVLSWKLCNNKYMIASTQITNTEIFASIAALVYKLFSRKEGYFLRK